MHIDPLWDADSCQQLIESLYKDPNIYPSKEHVLRSLSYKAPQDIRVVILGQDPYPTHGDAHGLSFSVEHGKPPRSLINIFNELEKDYPGLKRTDANLSDWAAQGVLLLNAVLTVPAQQAGGHLKVGWQPYTRSFLKLVAEQSPYAVWLLWGAKAAITAKDLVPDHHDILMAGHPSPLAYNQKKPNGFKNCKHFRQCNERLYAHGFEQIDWIGQLEYLQSNLFDD